MSESRKILSEITGREKLKPGEFIEADVSLILANDVTAPLAIKEFEKLGARELFDPDKVVFVLDHFTPNRDIASAEQCAIVRKFARERGMKHFYEGGQAGIEHVILPELGLVKPRSLIIGADSHTCTYGALGAFSTGMGSTDIAAAMATGKTWLKVPDAMRIELRGSFGGWVGGKDLILHVISRIGVDGASYLSMEFTGDGLESLSVDGRLTVANMVVEAGAKNGIFPVDRITREYLKSVGVESSTFTIEPDPYGYVSELTVDLSMLEPQVALPPLPSNAVPVSKAPKVKLDQVVIGSCTNGRIEDLRTAAEILKNKKVAASLRLIIIPGSPSVYKEALREGLIDIFLDAGSIISPPTCGPCLGGHMGVLASGERALSTTNRNFVGRMGHARSEVYLCNPAVAAASALTGTITDPGEII